MLRVFLMLIGAATLAGCITAPSIQSLTPEQRAKMASIETSSGGFGRPVTILQTVKGISCHRNAYQDKLLTSEEAIGSMKIMAAKISADGIQNIACQKNGNVDFSTNCWSSIVCVGDAVKFEQ